MASLLTTIKTTDGVLCEIVKLADLKSDTYTLALRAPCNVYPQGEPCVQIPLMEIFRYFRSPLETTHEAIHDALIAINELLEEREAIVNEASKSASGTCVDCGGDISTCLCPFFCECGPQDTCSKCEIPF